MLIGRKKEQQILFDALNDDKSSFIAIYGRRRIGKTFLVKETFSNRFTFRHLSKNVGNKYAIHPILITSHGLVNNIYSYVVQNVINKDDLFIDI